MSSWSVYVNWPKITKGRIFKKIQNWLATFLLILAKANSDIFTSLSPIKYFLRLLTQFEAQFDPIYNRRQKHYHASSFNISPLFFNKPSINNKTLNFIHVFKPSDIIRTTKKTFITTLVSLAAIRNNRRLSINDPARSRPETGNASIKKRI